MTLCSGQWRGHMFFVPAGVDILPCRKLYRQISINLWWLFPSTVASLKHWLVNRGAVDFQPIHRQLDKLKCSQQSLPGLDSICANLAAPRLSSSAEADDPVITGREEMHGFGVQTHLHVLLDARFRGHDSGEVA